MADLARRLGNVPRYVAVGVMESLWQWASRFAPAGDVGKWTPEGIAEGIDWKGPADELVAALVGSRFLDDVPDVGLVIHDWHDHADDAVHLSMARAGKVFWTGEIPRMGRMGKNERATCEGKYARSTHDVRTQNASMHAPPSPPLPSPPLPSPPLDSGVGGGVFRGEVQERGDQIKLTVEQLACYALMEPRPKWLPTKCDWLDIVTARDLATMPTTTQLFVGWQLDDIRKRHRTMTNPAGVFAKAIRRADRGLIAGITRAAQEEAERIAFEQEQSA